MISEVLIVSVLVYFGTHVRSLADAIGYIHGIGYTVGVINLTLCGFLSWHALKHIKAYCAALQYEVEEVKEHTDN